jgi:hypothetical protein
VSLLQLGLSRQNIVAHAHAGNPRSSLTHSHLPATRQTRRQIQRSGHRQEHSLLQGHQAPSFHFNASPTKHSKPVASSICSTPTAEFYKRSRVCWIASNCRANGCGRGECGASARQWAVSEYSAELWVLRLFGLGEFVVQEV